MRASATLVRKGKKGEMVIEEEVTQSGTGNRSRFVNKKVSDHQQTVIRW